MLTQYCRKPGPRLQTWVDFNGQVVTCPVNCVMILHIHFNCRTWINDFNPHYVMDIITFLCREYSWSMLVIGVTVRVYGAFGYPFHDNVIKWEHFARGWPFVRRMHRSPVDSPHKAHCLGALMFSLMCASMNGWPSNWDAGDLGRLGDHCAVTVMWKI